MVPDLGTQTMIYTKNVQKKDNPYFQNLTKSCNVYVYDFNGKIIWGHFQVLEFVYIFASYFAPYSIKRFFEHMC